MAEAVTTNSGKLEIWWWAGEETMVFPVNCEARSWAENGTGEGMWEARRENREWESIVFKTGNGKYWKHCGSQFQGGEIWRLEFPVWEVSTVCTFTGTLSSRAGAGKQRVGFKLICFHSASAMERGGQRNWWCLMSTESKTSWERWGTREKGAVRTWCFHRDTGKAVLDWELHHGKWTLRKQNNCKQDVRGGVIIQDARSREVGAG